MAAISAPLRAPSGRSAGEPQSNIGLALSVGGLMLLGAAMGLGLVFGELEALWVSLSVIAAIAVLYDFRAGAVLAIVLLPLSDSTLFPHALFGLTGLNPLNLLLATTVASYLLHGRIQKAGSVVPKQLVWLYVVPLVIAGIMGSRHA